MQIPALVEPAPQRPPDQPRVQPPGRDHLVAVAGRQHVGRAVGQPHPGARRRHLHDGPRIISHRVVHALVAGRDLQRGAVVVGAVVQSGQPAAAGVHAPGHLGRPVGPEYQLRRLDLHLEPQPPRLQAVGLLQPPAQLHHRADLIGRADLRQRDDEPVGQRAGAEQHTEKHIQRRDGAPPGPRLQALTPHPRERRCRASIERGGQRGRRRPRVGVLGGLTAVTVAVLEVQPEVLDRLGGEFGLDQRQHLGGQTRRQVHRRPELGGPRRAVRQQSQRLLSPPRGQPRLVPVGGNVHGMHRLPPSPLARITFRKRLVSARQQGVQFGPGGCRPGHGRLSSGYS